MTAISEKAKRNQAVYQRQWKIDNRDRANASARKRYTTDGRWEKQIRDRFGLEPEDYWKMHEEQKGLCAICGKPQTVGTKLDVDHDHVTGKVRALLCRQCNAGIGQLKDSIELVEKSLAYLRKHKEENMIVKIYDPPSGWKYGFPKIYKPLPGETLEQTLLRDGYPQEEIDWGGGKYARFWETELDKDD